jgi:transposase
MAYACDGEWMEAYSIDLRQRIVDAFKKAEGTAQEVAKRFKVTRKTVYNYLNLERETGSVAPRPHGGGPEPKLDEAGVQEVRAVLQEKNDRTLAEVADALDARLKVRVSRSTVQRVVDRLGLTRKKKRSARANRSGPMFSKSVRSSSRRASR